MPESIDARRKRIAFRCRQRGMLETSLLLRSFSKQQLPMMIEEELDRFELILDADDNELLDWIVGRNEPPAGIDRKILLLIKNFRNGLVPFDNK
jgi:antitoxin CptB